MDANFQTRMEDGKENLLKYEKESLLVFIGSKFLFNKAGDITKIQSINNSSTLLSIGTTSYYITKTVEGMPLEEKNNIKGFIKKINLGRILFLGRILLET